MQKAESALSVRGMKILTSSLVSFIIAAACAHAFSFGELAKNVSESAIAASASSKNIEELKTKQEATLAKYKKSKEDFLKGFAEVADSCGAETYAKQAKDALGKVEAQSAKTLDVQGAAQLTDEIIEKTSNGTALKLPEDAAAAAKTAAKSGLATIGEAIKGEMEVGRDVSELAEKVRDVMKNGTTAEKIALGSTLSPTLELAKLVPSDISKSKDAAVSIAKSLKEGGVKIPSSLASAIGL